MTTEFDEDFWDQRYSGSTTVWSGQANPQLVAEMSGNGHGAASASASASAFGRDYELTGERSEVSTESRPALSALSALDVGCGEGADAVWLARCGWNVTAVDISRVALKRAKEHASELDLAGSISWEHHNLLTWTPPASSFDLVSAQFMHLPTVDREPLYARLAAAVATGGTLLIVGHSATDIHAGARRPDVADLYFVTSEIAGSLDSEQWQILVSEPRPRVAQNSEGKPITIHDEVLRATRLA